MIGTLIRLSLLGSLLAAVLFLLKPLLRGRVSRSVTYYLWLLVLLRLCLPVGLTLTLPAGTPDAPVTASTVQDAGQTSVQPAATASTQEPTPTGETAPVTQPEASDPAPAPGVNWNQILVLVWAVGAALMAGWYIHGYRRLVRLIQSTAAPATPEAQAVLDQLNPIGSVRLVESTAVSSPLLLGIVHATIVLPPGLTDEARLRDILAHELTHAWRYDLLYKWFAAFAASVHWFNPLLPFIRKEIGQACELSCDEAVVQGLDAPSRKHYGETLLALAAEAPVGALPLAVTLCEEKKHLQERLVSIVKVHKRTPVAILLTLALVLGIGGCSLVSQAKAEEIEEIDPYGALYLPQADVTLHLGMTPREVKAQMGSAGDSFYLASMNTGSYYTSTYNTADGLILVQYVGYHTRQARVNSLQCIANPDHTVGGALTAQLTPEAEAAFRDAGPFQAQAVQETTYGDTMETLFARFPDGVRHVQPLGADPERLMTMYEVHGGGAATIFYLTPETGVYKIWISNGPFLEDAGENFTHSVTGFGYSTSPGDMAWGTLEETFGAPQPQGDSYLYGSGADALLVTDTENGGHTLEALGTHWSTVRGVHVGQTLGDITERYDCIERTDENGPFVRIEGTTYILTFRLDDSDTITSMRLEGKGDAS